MKQKLKGVGSKVVSALAVVAPAVGTVAFAADVTMPTLTVPTGVLDNLLSFVGETATSILPYGLGVMAIIVGVGLIPRFIYKFF